MDSENKYINRLDRALKYGDIREAVKQMWLIGMDISEIARELSLSKREVIKIFEENNFIYG